MFLFTMTYLQVMPTFLEMVFPFGEQHYARDFHFSGFASEHRLTDASRGLELKELKRSGKHLELCYSIKSVEHTKDVNPWSIRQCSVYHRYDLETEQTTWIIVKGNSLMQDLIRVHNLREFGGTGDSTGLTRSSFNATLDVHALIAAWAGENWHWYLNDLESSLQELTRPLLTSPFQTPPSNLPPLPEEGVSTTLWSPPNPSKKWTLRSMSKTVKRSFSWSTLHSNAETVYTEEPISTLQEQRSVTHAVDGFSFRDLPRVQSVQEKANELLLVLTANCTVLDRLRKDYMHFAAAAECPSTIKSGAIVALEEFEREIVDVMEKLTMQQSRAQALIHLVNERKAIVSLQL